MLRGHVTHFTVSEPDEANTAPEQGPVCVFRTCMQIHACMCGVCPPAPTLHLLYLSDSDGFVFLFLDVRVLLSSHLIAFFTLYTFFYVCTIMAQNNE